MYLDACGVKGKCCLQNCLKNVKNSAHLKGDICLRWDLFEVAKIHLDVVTVSTIQNPEVCRCCTQRELMVICCR